MCIYREPKTLAAPQPAVNTKQSPTPHNELAISVNLPQAATPIVGFRLDQAGTVDNNYQRDLTLKFQIFIYLLFIGLCVDPPENNSKKNKKKVQNIDGNKNHIPYNLNFCVEMNM